MRHGVEAPGAHAKLRGASHRESSPISMQAGSRFHRLGVPPNAQDRSGAGIGQLSYTQSPGGWLVYHTYDSVGRPIRTRTWAPDGQFYDVGRTYDATTGRLSQLDYPVWSTGTEPDTDGDGVPDGHRFAVQLIQLHQCQQRRRQQRIGFRQLKLATAVDEPPRVRRDESTPATYAMAQML